MNISLLYNNSAVQMHEIPRSGYDMIAAGDWPSLISTYGLQSIIVFIAAVVLLHYARKEMERYFREKREAEALMLEPSGEDENNGG